MLSIPPGHLPRETSQIGRWRGPPAPAHALHLENNPRGGPSVSAAHGARTRQSKELPPLRRSSFSSFSSLFHAISCPPPRICTSRQIAAAPREVERAEGCRPSPRAGRSVRSVAASRSEKVDTGLRNDESQHCWPGKFHCN